MTAESFYGKLIIFISTLVVVMGLLISLWLDPKVLPVGGSIMDKWLLGVLGATLTGWGVTILLVSLYAFREGSPQLIRYVLVGLMFWFIPDTIISVFYGVAINVVINFAILIIAGIPLYLGQKSLKGKNKIFIWE